jgi:DNA repair protein RecO (recombination protein O)
LVRKTPVRDVDLIVELYTEAAGSVSAVARGARRSSKRLSALEPMHGLAVSLEIAPARELATLSEAALERPRLALTSSLARMDAAGHALRWLRRASPPRSPEPAMWRAINALLDALDDPAIDAVRAPGLCAAAGLTLLTIAGWGLELERCVRCGKPCPPGARAVIDVRAGGVVCSRCGGLGPQVGSALRAMMIAATSGDTGALAEPQDAREVIAICDAALEAHGRGEAS